MPTDMFRMVAFTQLLERGADQRVAAQGSVAIHFLHDDLRPSHRQFEKACRKATKRTAKAAKKAPVDDLGPLFVAALQELKALALEMGEPEYAEQAERQLNPDPE